MQSIGNRQDSLGGPILVITNGLTTLTVLRYQSRRQIDIFPGYFRTWLSKVYGVPAAHC